MADNHSKEVRSMNMSHIRSKNSKPEEKGFYNKCWGQANEPDPKVIIIG